MCELDAAMPVAVAGEASFSTVDVVQDIGQVDGAAVVNVPVLEAEDGLDVLLSERSHALRPLSDSGYACQQGATPYCQQVPGVPVGATTQRKAGTEAGCGVSGERAAQELLARRLGILEPSECFDEAAFKRYEALFDGPLSPMATRAIQGLVKAMNKMRKAGKMPVGLGTKVVSAVA